MTWDRVSLTARISNAETRQRFAAGSPNHAETELYRHLLYGQTAFFDVTPPQVVVLGMTPELRAMALEAAHSVLAVDESSEAIDLYSDWVPAAQRVRETVRCSDWLQALEQLKHPVDGVLGDGVFGNVLDIEAQRRLLIAIERVLSPGGVLVLRQALIPEGFDVQSTRAESLLERFRRGELDETEFAFAMRLWGSFEQAYDKGSCLLDNSVAFARYEIWLSEGKITPSEHALIRRYYYSGRTSLLPQRAWEAALNESGFAWRQYALSGKDWYRYYPLYSCQPARRPRPTRPAGPRLQIHRSLRRQVHVCLLEVQARPGFSQLMAYWINERCQRVSASVGARLEGADVVWVSSQDPLDTAQKHKLAELLRRRRSGVRVINPLQTYNAYHEADAFSRLSAAGVHVPRLEFGEPDLGKTSVVYKRSGEQMSNKERTSYSGPRSGYRVFEYIDGRGPDGRFRRYRAFYVLGAVRPSKLMRCDHWNVCLKHEPVLEYGFEMTPEEIEQLRLIARALGLDYFAVDFVRRAGDERAFYVDINIYPRLFSTHQTNKEFGLGGGFHTFDTRQRFGFPEPGGVPFWRVFEDALLRFARGEPYPAAPGVLNALVNA